MRENLKQIALCNLRYEWFAAGALALPLIGLFWAVDQSFATLILTISASVTAHLFRIQIAPSRARLTPRFTYPHLVVGLSPGVLFAFLIALPPFISNPSVTSPFFASFAWLLFAFIAALVMNFRFPKIGFLVIPVAAFYAMAFDFFELYYNAQLIRLMSAAPLFFLSTILLFGILVLGIRRTTEESPNYWLYGKGMAGRHSGEQQTSHREMRPTEYLIPWLFHAEDLEGVRTFATGSLWQRIRHWQAGAFYRPRLLNWLLLLLLPSLFFGLIRFITGGSFGIFFMTLGVPLYAVITLVLVRQRPLEIELLRPVRRKRLLLELALAVALSYFQIFITAAFACWVFGSLWNPADQFNMEALNQFRFNGIAAVVLLGIYFLGTTLAYRRSERSFLFILIIGIVGFVILSWILMMIIMSDFYGLNWLLRIASYSPIGAALLFTLTCTAIAYRSWMNKDLA